MVALLQQRLKELFLDRFIRHKKSFYKRQKLMLNIENVPLKFIQLLIGKYTYNTPALHTIVYIKSRYIKT